MADKRSYIHAQRVSPDPIRGVRDPRRLAAVIDAELRGHLDDRDLNAVVSTLRIACSVPIAVVNIVTENLQTYPAEVGVGAPCTSVPDELSFCAEVVESGDELAVADAGTHPVYCQNPLVLDGVVGAYAGVPLVDNGVVLGSVSIFDSRAREFTADELEVLRQQGRLASTVLALRRSARTDTLTGLPNRRLYLDRLIQGLARLERHAGLLAVMYLDVNGFKTLNDSFGHEVGDWVLAELAQRLTAVMRTTDSLARFGGDEFVALCEDLTSRGDAELMAERMLAAVGNGWVKDGQALAVSISIGIALTDVQTSAPADLLRNADAAMYSAKKLGRSGWVVAPTGPSAIPLLPGS